MCEKPSANLNAMDLLYMTTPTKAQDFRLRDLEQGAFLLARLSIATGLDRVVSAGRLKVRANAD